MAERARLGRETALGAVLFAVFLLGALGTQRYLEAPWELFVVLLPVGAFLVWWRVARRPVTELGFHRVSGWSWHLVLPALVAVLYTAATIVVAHEVGFRSTAEVTAAPGTILLVALIIAPLVGVLLTAIPEEFVFRGFYLRVLEARAGLVIAAVASSVLFAAAHVPNLLDQGLGADVVGVRLVSDACFGLVMVWTVVRTRALWFAIAWHGGTNYASVVASTAVGSQLAPGVPAALFDLATVVGHALLATMLLLRWPPTERITTAEPQG